MAIERDPARGPELRIDPLGETWSILAEARAGRPHDVAGSPPYAAVMNDAEHGSHCPFCAGHERETTPEVWAARPASSPADTPGWQVRIVTNKYPAVIGAEPGFDETFPLGEGPALGVHEVIIESPRHVTSWRELDLPAVREVFRAYRARLGDLRRSGRWRYGLIFKNVGARGGASLAHVHSQLLALESVPPLVTRRWEGLRRHYEQAGQCALCQRVEHERLGPRRVVETAEFVAFCPRVSRWAGETWLVPRRHLIHFDTLEDEALDELAALAYNLVERLERWHAPPAYNLVLQTSPWHAGSSTAGEEPIATPAFHWWWELLPRVTNLAGFELATGGWINPLSPESAASTLRSLGDERG